MWDNIPSSSTILTVDDEILRDNNEQLGTSLIPILNVSLSSGVKSSMMSILNGEDVVDPAEIFKVNTEVVIL